MNLLSRGSAPAILTVLAVVILLYLVRLFPKSVLLGGVLLGGSGAHGQKTVISIDGSVKQANVKRLGVNLGNQTYYDSRQILRNLLSRNPGFEGQEWQSILQCKLVTATSCTDWNRSTAWPENFLTGGTYEFIVGGAKGRTGTITSSTSKLPDGTSGITVNLSPGAQVPVANDYVVVRKETLGNGGAGWATGANGGGAISTESTDLSPNTPGKQALRMEASQPGQTAQAKQYFDSTAGFSFVQMRGTYTVKFRAKGIGGNNTLFLGMRRFLTKGGSEPLLDRKIVLTGEWKDYSLDFEPHEDGTDIGTAEFGMAVNGGSVLLDDVSLAQAPTAANPTAFRDEVVATLKRLHPGEMRYMDSGTNFGSSLDNMLAPEFARERTGFHKRVAEAQDIPIGLHDFLVLCQTLGVEPWYTVQMGMSQPDLRNLIEYLSGPATSPYGAKRAKLGQKEPWTSVFPTIHLEAGNEAWNSIAQGEEIHDPIAYAMRSSQMFQTMRSSPDFKPAKFDLITNGFTVNLYWMGRLLAVATDYDTIDFAPYLYSPFNDDSSDEAIFGPMLAEPEMVDSTPNGIMHQETELVTHAKHPGKVAVYETNIGTTEGTVPQESVDKSIPSIAAGLSSVEHMLLMMRDLGIRDQNTFTLAQQGFGFNNTKTHAREGSPVWGIVLDMGGTKNRVRPSFLAQQLADEAILPTMLTAVVQGNDPTWDQPLSPNAKVVLPKAHILQTFAFTDGKRDTVIVFNLSRTESKTVSFAGLHGPQGSVIVKTLTSAKITDSNENADTVKIGEQKVEAGAVGSKPFVLPPFSMTSISSFRK